MAVVSCPVISRLKQRKQICRGQCVLLPGSVWGWLLVGIGALEPGADLRGIREAQTGQDAQSRLPGVPGGGRVPGRVLHVAEPD